MQVELKQRV